MAHEFVIGVLLDCQYPGIPKYRAIDLCCPKNVPVISLLWKDGSTGKLVVTEQPTVAMKECFETKTMEVKINVSILVGGSNPSEKYARQNWIISPGRDEHKKDLKPPPRFFLK